MHELFKKTLAVGFDLDGTLYKSTQEMDNRIRSLVAEKILEKKPELRNIENARELYEREYVELESGMKVLEKAGYRNAGEIMLDCLDRSNILDLIQRDDILAGILSEIAEKKFTYLITTGTRSTSISKLQKLGINPALFGISIFGDDLLILKKQKAPAFQYVMQKSKINAGNHVYVGDRRNADVLLPKELGMRTIAVWNPISEADFYIEHIHNLREILL